jgi:dTDP-4-amino-4,6-dideoxygalactose transaminase
VYNQFVIRADQRDRLQEHLAANRIGTAVYYPIPLHLQDCFSHLGVKEGALPNSEAASREVLALPIFPGLREQQLAKVVRSIKEFYAAGS